MQNNPRFLPGEERDAAEILSRCMARDGVTIRLNTEVIGARRDGEQKILKTVDGATGQCHEFPADEILVCVGRVANVDNLDLERAGVEVRDNRLHVDACQKSSTPNIYAAGDVCLPIRFTNAALASARAAVGNSLEGKRVQIGDQPIPWCTFCDPEIAHIGLHVREARQHSIPIRTFSILMQDVDRAILDAEDIGFVKIHVMSEGDKILGPL